MSTINIDQNEIKKFSDAASRWWDQNSEFKSLHEINPLRLQFVQEHAPLANKKVLDIGCGGGILTESMASLKAHVTGIDMSEAALNIARLHQLESKIVVDYQLITAEAMAAQQPEAFDVVTCMEMLEHVPSPESIVQAAATLVKPGGDVFFSTLNRNPKSYLFAIVGAEYLLKLLPAHTHDYAKFIRPSELENWARQHGLAVQAMIGITYNPFTKKYKLSNDISVNYLIHAKRNLS